MTKRFRFNWCVWIGVWTGIYAGLYLISPLAQFGVIYVTFVALPIYFMSGTKKEEYPNFALGNVTGVLWGMGYVFLINTLIERGMNDVLSTALVCLVVTLACCALHMIVTPNTVFNKLPAMFGGISAVFSTWGQHMVPLMITLVLGTTLALVMVAGTKLLTPEGYWKFFKKS